MIARLFCTSKKPKIHPLQRACLEMLLRVSLDPHYPCDAISWHACDYLLFIKNPESEEHRELNLKYKAFIKKTTIGVISPEELEEFKQLLRHPEIENNLDIGGDRNIRILHAAAASPSRNVFIPFDAKKRELLDSFIHDIVYVVYLIDEKGEQQRLDDSIHRSAAECYIKAANAYQDLCLFFTDENKKKPEKNLEVLKEIIQSVNFRINRAEYLDTLTRFQKQLQSQTPCLLQRRRN